MKREGEMREEERGENCLQSNFGYLGFQSEVFVNGEAKGFVQRLNLTEHNNNNNNTLHSYY